MFAEHESTLQPVVVDSSNDSSELAERQLLLEATKVRLASVVTQLPQLSIDDSSVDGSSGGHSENRSPYNSPSTPPSPPKIISEGGKTVTKEPLAKPQAKVKPPLSPRKLNSLDKTKENSSTSKMQGLNRTKETSGFSTPNRQPSK